MAQEVEYQTVSLPKAKQSSLVQPGAPAIERQMIFDTLKGLKWVSASTDQQIAETVYEARCPKLMPFGNERVPISIGEWLALAGFVNDEEGNNATITHLSEDDKQCCIRVSGFRNVTALLAIDANFPGKAEIEAAYPPGALRRFLDSVEPMGAGERRYAGR